MNRPAALGTTETGQLERVLAVLNDVLGRELVGVYLHGSASLGGLRPRSDLDVFAVARRRVSPDERQRLVSGLLPVWGRDVEGPLRPIEVTLVAEPDVRPWRYPARRDFQYGEWLRDAFEAGDVDAGGPVIDPDLAPLITIVLKADVRLQGPPPAEVLEAVPHRHLLAATLDCVDGVVADLNGDTRNAVLTLARVWTTVVTGIIRSKDEAATWAVERLPEEHRAVLLRARGIYVGEVEERWDDLEPRLAPFADHVVGRIRRVAAEAS